ncbi:MAG: HRDC domain-containing protein [Planctomycetota bacterium]
MSSDPGAGLGAELLTLRFDPAAGAFDDTALRARLAEVHLLALREHFFTAHGLPHVACLLTYRAASAPDAAKRASPPLPEAAQPVYETLRRWRAERARAEGVPAYVLFTNRELQAIAATQPRSDTALRAIPGIGAKKVARHGTQILALLAPAPEGTDHKEAAPDEADA